MKARAPENTDPKSMDTTDNFTIGGVFKQEPLQSRKNEKKRQDNLQKTKDGYNRVSMCTKENKKRSTKGKNNNFSKEVTYLRS